jgi:hypothetical protein
MYTIQMHRTNIEGGQVQLDKVRNALTIRLARSRFRAEIQTGVVKDRPCIFLKPVRLRSPKPYCGNHPGPCEVIPGIQRRKPKATWLEWDDWVAFHKLVNAVLNRLRVKADVWSTPADVRGKMWIRRDNKPRLKWDWTETYNSVGRAVRVWNTGTDDQFEKEPPMTISSSSCIIPPAFPCKHEDTYCNDRMQTACHNCGEELGR